MKILLTGHKGDIGSVFYDMYKAKGFDVYSFNKFADIKADRIVHLAAKSPPADPDEIIASNINHLQEIVRYTERNQIREIVFFSAMAIYGNPNKEDIEEEDGIFSPNFYAISKLLGEEYLRNHNTMNILCIRLPAILGFRNTTNFLSRCYVKLRNNEAITLTNYNRLLNNFISIENLFDFLTSLKINKKFDVINLAVKKELKMSAIVEMMKNELGSQSEIILSDDQRNFFNISTKKAVQEYNFHPYSTAVTVLKWLTQKTEYEKGLKGNLTEINISQ